MYFVDESGSIPTFFSKRWANRYFVIAFVHTQSPNHLDRVYSDSLRNVRKYYPDYFKGSGELKGSAAPPFVKDYLLSRLLRKTDIKIGYIVADNWNIRENFRKIPSRSFNYLTKLVMMSHTLSSHDRAILTMKIDNRNSAVQSLKSLEEYLYQELVLGEGITSYVDVEYCESSLHPNIQVADLVASTIYSYYRFRHIKFPKIADSRVKLDTPSPEVVKYLYGLIEPRLFFNQMFPGKPIVGIAL